MAKKHTNPVVKFVGTTIKVGCIATGALFTVYFLNLDQKLLAWSYARVNEIFDRKPVDIKF
ncbi:MAG: hypothetical protein IKE85_03680 [Mogibacterium sp.]|nr:hypothetical protein [Mogibacterium sp.]MBR2539920.1 hypothetical protein [Mogibacterium sp.]